MIFENLENALLKWTLIDFSFFQQFLNFLISSNLRYIYFLCCCYANIFLNYIVIFTPFFLTLYSLLLKIYYPNSQYSKICRTISINLHAIFLTLKILLFLNLNTRVFHLPFFFFPFNSRHTYPIRSSFAAQTRFIHLYNFILLFLSRFFFNTCSRGNSIWKFYVAELDRESYSRVYSSLFDPKE